MGTLEFVEVEARVAPVAPTSYEVLRMTLWEEVIRQIPEWSDAMTRVPERAEGWSVRELLEALRSASIDIIARRSLQSSKLNGCGIVCPSTGVMIEASSVTMVQMTKAVSGFIPGSHVTHTIRTIRTRVRVIRHQARVMCRSFVVRGGIGRRLVRSVCAE